MARVEYCDLCDSPLKNREYYLLHIAFANAVSHYDNVEDYYKYVDKLEKEVKDLCPTCKEIIDEIFKLRKGKLNELSEELLGIYKKPTKKPPHGDKRKNKKKKKK